MLKSLRYLNVAVQLADKRILLSRKHIGGDRFTQWAITIERFLGETQEALSELNKVAWEVFGIDAQTYSDSFLEFRRIHPIYHTNVFMIPFIMKFKSSLAFQVKKEMQFAAIPLDKLLVDIMENSAFPKNGGPSKHTCNAIYMAKEIQLRGLFN